MDRRETEQRLLAWDQDELFYREYYRRMQAGEPLDDLDNREELPWEWKNCGIVVNKTEEDFFRDERNIALIKHPRYFPYFEHQHTFFEMIYVLSGHCREVTEGREIWLNQGDLFILAPSITHGIEVMDDSVVLNILIRHNTFMDIFLNTVRDKSQIALFFLGNLYEKDKIPYLLYHMGNDANMKNYILDLAQEQQAEDEYADKISCSLLTVFFYQLTRGYADTMETPGVVRERTNSQNEMLRFIMDNYRTVTLKELADVFHFSVPYCSKLIKETTGFSFLELVTQVRLQQGENLLSHTQMNVGDIGYEIGYKNTETFIRAFTRSYKVSPSRYRKSVMLAKEPV